MFDYLYEWIRDISYYMILVTAVTYVLPSNAYRKYIRFFTGLVLILMLMTPVMDLFRMEAIDGKEILEKYLSEYENNMPKFAGDMEEFDDRHDADNEKIQNGEVQIEVEDIVIGP